jgi:hypothetical protein
VWRHGKVFIQISLYFASRVRRGGIITPAKFLNELCNVCGFMYCVDLQHYASSFNRLPYSRGLMCERRGRWALVASNNGGIADCCYFDVRTLNWVRDAMKVKWLREIASLTSRSPWIWGKANMLSEKNKYVNMHRNTFSSKLIHYHVFFHLSRAFTHSRSQNNPSLLAGCTRK